MKSKISKKALILGLTTFYAICAIPSLVSARVTGECVECHTMHNSQDGTEMMYNDTIDTGLERALTRGSCVGCHTGTNTGANVIPYVDDRTAVPNYFEPADATGNTLAGGSFYWVRTGADNLGHNVEGIKAADVALGNTPPGFDSATNGDVYQTGSRLTCAGTNGCHGNQDVADSYGDLAGAHHGDDTTITGNTLATSFRFLLGVEGYEDSDWEYQATASAHNQYKGQDRTGDTQRLVNGTSGGPSTISGLCGNCHGDFHANTNGEISNAGDMSNPWMRHPTDFDMARAAGTTEYEQYNAAAGGVAGTYSVEAPVASADVSAVLASVNVTTGNDTAIVTCISCHRAHGSPFADLLRWDYAGMIAHNATGQDTDNGCFVCHTTKDDV